MARYVLDRGHPFIDPISSERAAQIFERAKSDPYAELTGDLESGFSYVSVRSGATNVLRVKVRPVEDDAGTV